MRSYPKRIRSKQDLTNLYDTYPALTLSDALRLADTSSAAYRSNVGFSSVTEVLDFIEEMVSVESFTITSPYVSKATTAKVGMHNHTTASDGEATSNQMMEAALAAGFDALALTDHDWGDPTEEPTTEGIIYIAGSEISAPYHHNTYVGYDTVSTNHPYYQTWVSGVNPAHSEKLCEIWNVGDYNLNLPATFYIDEPWFDYYLTIGDTCWCMAGADAHTTSAINVAWSIVYLDSMTKNNIMESLAAGNHYCSTGPDITITNGDNYIKVVSSVACDFDFIGKAPSLGNPVTGVGMVMGTTYHSVKNQLSAYYVPRGDEQYIRVRATRVSDKAYASQKMAYSQPLTIS